MIMSQSLWASILQLNRWNTLSVNVLHFAFPHYDKEHNWGDSIFLSKHIFSCKLVIHKHSSWKILDHRLVVNIWAFINLEIFLQFWCNRYIIFWCRNSLYTRANKTLWAERLGTGHISVVIVCKLSSWWLPLRYIHSHLHGFIFPFVWEIEGW